MIDTPIQYVKGIGPKLAKRFEKLGMSTAFELLMTFPKTHENRSDLPKVSQLSRHEVQACVVQVQSVKKVDRKPPIIQVVLSDQTGSIMGVWFNQGYLEKKLTAGKWLYIKGKLVYNSYQGQNQFHVSDFEWLEGPALTGIVPVYGLTTGITQSKMRQLVQGALHDHLPELIDPLQAYCQSLSMLPLRDAIYHMHLPRDARHFKLARQRLAFDELLMIQLPLLLIKQRIKTNHVAHALTPTAKLVNAYLGQLPYTLTGAQQRAVMSIRKDVESTHPMNRLLQGDVGAGKTEVATITALMAIESGKKAVLMAPTEILATQHTLKLTERLVPLGVEVVLLKGKTTAKQREQIKAILQAEIPVVLVGTHAVLEDDIQIDSLGVIIIDEQHRFGVMQRLKLNQKGIQPHCLFMTATPIPRSLMLTYYGDLDKTIIDELPPGRTPVMTIAKPMAKLDDVIAFCQKQIAAEHQVYIVLPLVEDSEKLDLKSATGEFERLQTQLPEVSMSLLHGKLPQAEKEAIMTAFRANETQLLVSTTVIEVGVDVPNATTMVIYHAQRFGLSQLHQLRGRVGRGAAKSTCILVADPKTPEGKQRIKAMVESTDGFHIAGVDLSIRGPGDMLGTRQSGLPSLQVANPVTDQPILEKVKQLAQTIMANDPGLTLPIHKQLKIRLRQSSGALLDAHLN